MTVDDLDSKLGEFLAAVPQYFPNLTHAPLNIRFPASENSTVMGSEIGSAFWNNESAKALLLCLLEDEQISANLRPYEDQEAIELHGILASYVESWIESRQDSSTFVSQTATNLVAEMRLAERACTAFRVVSGIEVPSGSGGAQLSFGISIRPASTENLQSLFVNAGMNPDEAVKLPAGPSAIIVVEQHFTRTEMGPLTSTSAFAFSVARGMQVRMAIWLASGRVTPLGDTFAFEQAAYPAIQRQQIPAALERRFPWSQGTWVVDQEAVNVLEQVLRHIGVFWGWVTPVVEHEQTRNEVWTALGYLDSALNSSDWALIMLLSYSALDGLLLAREDHDSRLVYRVSWLIGRDDEERQRIRRFMNRLYYARSKVAHGERPTEDELVGLIDDESLSRVHEPAIVLQGRVRDRCLELARRGVLAYVWLTLSQNDSDATSFERTKADITSIIDSARANEQTAKSELRQNAVLEWFGDPV